MATSSNFDSEHELTGDDAARLIVGDQHSGSKRHETALVLKKLEAAYKLALKYYELIWASDDEYRWTSPGRPTIDPGAIRCSTMEQCERLMLPDSNGAGDPKGATLTAWLTHGATAFAAQMFDRDELQRWIDVVGITSAYRYPGQSNKFPPSPVEAGVQQKAPVAAWNLVRPKRLPGYRKSLFDFLRAAQMAGKSCPSARDVLDAWKTNPPFDVQVMADSIKYNNGMGTLKEANLKAIQQAIKALLRVEAG